MGAPLIWYRLMNNLRDKGITKNTMKIDSGDRHTEFPKELIDLCYNVAVTVNAVCDMCVLCIFISKTLNHNCGRHYSYGYNVIQPNFDL